MPLSPFLASSRQPPVAASCSCCQPCSHGRHAGNIDCKTSRCSSTVRRGHSCERGSNEIPLQLLSIQLCQIYESIFLMLFSCHLWDFTDMPKQATHVQSIPRFKQSTVQQELSAEAIQCIHIHKEIKKKESKKEKGEEFWKDHFVHLDDHNKML